jgi:enoyl-CoA hydratase/carnithine racemase
MKAYQAIDISIKDQVATITILVSHQSGLARARPRVHPELGSAFSELREDNSVRVIVLTGSEGRFHLAPPSESYVDNASSAHFNDPTNMWNTFLGVVRCHQGMTEIEKPIVAKVNGDAIGFGQSLAFASDIIIAREDARFMDHHMSGVFTADYSGVTKQGGHDFSSVPGDGGAALIPLYMSPPKAKEYLMLAKAYTGAELAQMGAINYAVPADQLDAKVESIVQQLLERGAYALAWAKRIANRRVADQLNLTLDAGQAYEMLVWLQREKLGWKEKKTLD